MKKYLTLLFISLLAISCSIESGSGKHVDSDIQSSIDYIKDEAISTPLEIMQTCYQVNQFILDGKKATEPFYLKDNLYFKDSTEVALTDYPKYIIRNNNNNLFEPKAEWIVENFNHQFSSTHYLVTTLADGKSWTIEKLVGDKKHDWAYSRKNEVEFIATVSFTEEVKKYNEYKWQLSIIGRIRGDKLGKINFKADNLSVKGKVIKNEFISFTINGKLNYNLLDGSVKVADAIYDFETKSTDIKYY